MSVPKTVVDDLTWLNERMRALSDGLTAAKDIWDNWTEGRNVSRFSGGLTYGDFIKANLPMGGIRLKEALAIMPGASTREVAKVAGVSKSTVAVAKQAGVQNGTPAPAKVLGGDGKSYPAKKKEKPTSTSLPFAAPVIAGMPQPPKPSPEAAEALVLLKKVAGLNAARIISTMTRTQHDRLKKAAKRAEKVCQTLGTQVSIP